MANTQDIKRRIKSISNTRQLTRAMKMVSAAKLRRAQERILAARPYAEGTEKVLQNLAARAGDESSPLLQVHGDRRVAIVLVTGDKGLCGAFNSSIIRQAENLAKSLDGKEITFNTIGRKGRAYFQRRGYTITNEWEEVFRDISFSLVQKISSTIIKLYVDQEVDQVYLVYNRFKSAMQSIPVERQLLPVKPVEFEPGEYPEEYLYEPAAGVLLAELLPHYVEVEVYRAMLESVAAEHAARMTAMDSATNNAGDLIDSLTLTMNRARQASITTEIIEVVSGAQAMG